MTARKDKGPRTRGSAAMPGVVSYRVKRYERTKTGRMFVAVMASVNGAPARLIGVELAADECSEWGPDERKLRAAVEAAVAELSRRRAILTIRNGY